MKLHDIVCRRIGGRLEAGNRVLVNIRQAVVQHSPDGFEWGYGGSGPADLALNILHLFIPTGSDGEEPIPLYRGECSRTAWVLHQRFKREFIASLPDHGGTIYACEIVDWLRENCPSYIPPA